MKIVASGLLALLFALTQGCETASGFGQDLENAGEAITDTAEDTEDDLD